MRENHGIAKAEVLEMTDYELEMWLRSDEELGRGMVRVSGDRGPIADGKWHERHDRS